MNNDSRKVKLKLEEYKEVFNIFKGLCSTKNFPTFKKFKKNLDTFFELTFDAYMGNMGSISNNEAMAKWIEFIGSKKVALDYFHAVDTWHPYT